MADKKISELPLLNSVSGSSMIIPVVHDGTTVKVNLSQIGHYASQWSAKTGSANTFAGTQTFSGNVNINGRLTVHEIYANYETSSILYTSGSSQFGDQTSDVHTFVGTILLNGSALGDSGINSFTASQLAVNLGISSVTGSINTTTSSFDSVFQRISSTTGSINTTTSSFDLVFRGISSVTGAMNTQSSSQDLVNRQVSLVTGSIHFVTGAFNAFTGSVVGQTNTIATFTSSINFATQSLNTQTGSQDSVNFRIASTTGSINTTTSSFDLVFRGISSVTGAMNTQSSSQDLVNRGISSVTGSINTTTSSFDLVFRGISSVTGAINLTTSSLIGITNGLMAFTAALDNTYATDAQLYQLYQATASIHFATQSLNTQTGSIGSVLSGLSNVTSAYATTFNSIDAHILKQSIQTGSQESINTTISVVTGSLRAEIGGIESYTASLKAAAIVSSSTQISNYYKFAETASASTTFYGNVISNGNIQANKFVFTDGVVSQNVGGQNIIGTSGNILYLYTGTSGLYINNQANNAQNVTITDAGVVTTRGALTIGGPGNDQNLTFGGTNSSIYWGAGGPARMYYNVGDIKVSSNGAADVLNVQNIGGILVSGGITGSLMATNGVISGSVQLPEIAGIEAYTSSLKNAFTIDTNNDVYFSGKITTQEVHTTYTTSSVLFQSGSTKFGNTPDDRHEFTGSLLVSHSFEVIESSTGATKGDFFVDSPNKYVYVGRQSATSGDNTTFVVRDRTNTARATIPGGGSIDTIFSTNASNFKVTNYSGTPMFTISNTGNITGSGNLWIQSNAQIGANTTSKHELTGSLNVSGSMTISGSVQTFSEIGIEMTSTTGVNKITARRSNSLSDNTTLDTGINQSGLLVVNTNSDRCGLFLVNCIGGGSSTVTEISDPASYYTTTKDNAGSFNVYFDGGNGNVIAQNKTGVARTFSLTIIGGS